MKFMNLLNTDPYVKNLVIHGVEGKHYTKVDDKTVEPIANSGYSLYKESWSIGNVFLDYLLPNDDPEKYEKLRAYNDNAVDSAVNGFLPKAVTDPAVKQRNIEINNTTNNFLKQLRVGAVETEPTYTEFLDTLEKAGINEQIAATTEEYREYLKNQK